MEFDCLATAAFGLEGLVASELRRMNCPDVRPENGGVRFRSDLDQVFRCNLNLRCCDRVYLLLAEEKCLTFEDLFQLVKSVPWERYMEGTEAINLSAHCARSRIMSPRDCQSIAKKAIIQRLQEKTGRRVFPESGAPLPVQVAFHSDQARILLNTSGEALSRRGYRTWNGEAPLRETLAAALVSLSPWRPGMPLHDPCCGTGTLLVEAAFQALHRAPGLRRSFAMEAFAFCRNLDFSGMRAACTAEETPDRPGTISGSDLDPEALKLAGRHLRQAGLEGKIALSCQPLEQLTLAADEPGVFLCNPPYGERLQDQASCRKLYRELRLLRERHPGWALCAISSDPAFERAYGQRATKKRRLYNGRLECNYYIYT